MDRPHRLGRPADVLGAKRRDRPLDRRHGRRSRSGDPAPAGRGGGGGMSAVGDGSRAREPSGSLLRRIAWHWRHDPKRELWIGWWTMVVFYNLYGLLFFVVTRTQPPPKPSLDARRDRAVVRRSALRPALRLRLRLHRRRRDGDHERDARLFDAAHVGESRVRVLVPRDLRARDASRHAAHGHRAARSAPCDPTAIPR